MGKATGFVIDINTVPLYKILWPLYKINKMAWLLAVTQFIIPVL